MVALIIKARASNATRQRKRAGKRPIRQELSKEQCTERKIGGVRQLVRQHLALAIVQP